MQPPKHIRILSEDQLPDSSGGIFNPSAVITSTPNERIILMRKEALHKYTNDSSQVLIIEKIEKLRFGEVDNLYYPNCVGFPQDSKQEDFRLFNYKGEFYAIHTLCVTKKSWSDATLLKPVISKVTRSEIKLVDWCDLPYVQRKIGEKNWLPIVHNDELYILYSLDPLRIYKLEGWSWREVCNEDSGLALTVKEMMPKSSYLSLSAITHWKDDLWIGFWHVRDINYEQGMFILNMRTFKIENFTPPVLHGGDLPGHRPDCLYVSGLVNNGQTLEVYCGTGDSHSDLIELEINDVAQTISEHPYKYMTPLKVLMKDLGVGDFICMAYALMGWMNETGRGARIYVTKNLQLASVLKLPNVKVVQYNGETVEVDFDTNENDLPYKERKQFQAKIKGSFKEWYAEKLNTKPLAPIMDHIKPLEGYEDAIVLFPFASKVEYGRDWEVGNWMALATQLISEGHRVIISDPFPDRCRNLPGEHLTAISMLDTFRLVKGAKLVVANESGGAHIAGLFDTKTIVLSGWLNPKLVYDYTNNDYIYREPLQSITVEEVKEKILGMLKE